MRLQSDCSRWTGEIRERDLNYRLDRLHWESQGCGVR